MVDPTLAPPPSLCILVLSQPDLIVISPNLIEFSEQLKEKIERCLLQRVVLCERKKRGVLSLSGGGSWALLPQEVNEGVWGRSRALYPPPQDPIIDTLNSPTCPSSSFTLTTLTAPPPFLVSTNQSSITFEILVLLAFFVNER